MTIYLNYQHLKRAWNFILVDFNINAVVFRVIMCSNYNFLKTGFCLNRKIQQRIGSYLKMNHKVIPKDLNLCVYVPIKLTKYFPFSKTFCGRPVQANWRASSADIFQSVWIHRKCSNHERSIYIGRHIIIIIIIIIILGVINIITRWPVMF